MKIPFFKDIGKANDIFKQDNYCLNKTIQFTCKTDFGKFKKKTVLEDSKLKTKLTVNKSVDSVGDFEVTSSGNDLNVELTNKKLVDKTEFVLAGGTKGSYEATAKYRSDNAVAKLNAKLAKGEPTCMASGVVGYDGVSVGISAEFAPNEDVANVVKDYNAAVDWQVDDKTTYSMKASDCCDKLEATFIKGISDNATLAAKMNYNFQLKSTSLSVGSELKYGGGTMSSTYDSKGLLSFLYKRKLSDAMTLSAAARYSMATGGAWLTSWKMEVST